MYLTFEDYTTMGGTLDVTTFESLEYEAEVQINLYTYNRLKDEPQPIEIEAVKRCVVALIDLLKKQKDANTLGIQADGSGIPNIASQSNDGVSISYNTRSASELLQSASKDINDIISTYLNGVRNSIGHKLLYKGLYADE